MEYKKLDHFNELATQHFELKKKYDKEKDKERSKEHKKLFEGYDLLAYNELADNQLEISDLYRREVSKVSTRANRTTRYYHYKNWKTSTLAEKERWGIDIIKMALEGKEKPVVSCSFGIDSIVTLYLVRKALVELGKDPSEIQIVWNDTLNEFPEVRQYAMELKREWNLNLIVTKPKMSLKQVITKNGGIDSSYFTARKGARSGGIPLSEKCCGTLKHEPMHRAIKENTWDLVLNGLRSDESTQRLRAGLRDGEYFYSSSEWKAFTCRPILWMTDDDIWEYVEQEDIPYNSLYTKNMLMEYPKNNEELIESNLDELLESGIDVQELKEQQASNFTRKQAKILEKIGYKMFTPRTGCMMCPIPVKYGYLQWMRQQYPKIYKSMVYNLGYGKALLELVPDDVKEEIAFVTGIDVNEENADQYLKEILEAKPCTFDKFS